MSTLSKEFPHDTHEKCSHEVPKVYDHCRGVVDVDVNGSVHRVIPPTLGKITYITLGGCSVWVSIEEKTS